MGKNWIELGNGAGRNNQNRNEMLGGLFLWAFRDAIAYTGYYSNGKYPDDFYRRIASEVNTACDSGALNCFAKRESMSPVWHWYYMKYLYLPRLNE